MTIGQDSTGEVDVLDPAEGQPPKDLSEKSQMVEDMGASDAPIFISNNLPYIQSLEYGHSGQAPQGMVGVTMSEVKNGMTKFIKESGF